MRQLRGRPEHANAVETEVLLARIVVDQADRRVAEAGRALHLADDELGGVARTDDDHFLAARDEPGRVGPLDQAARDQPRSGDEREQEEPVEDRDRARELEALDRVREQDDEVGDDARGRDAARRAPHVPRGHVSPPPVVEAEEHEDHQLQGDRDPDRVDHEAVIRARYAVVEAEPEGEPPCERDQRRVGDDVPDAVTVDRDHRVATAAASRTTSTTRSWVVASMPAHSGTEKFSCARRSVSGSEPGR